MADVVKGEWPGGAEAEGMMSLRLSRTGLFLL
jgi:hypothetical protein